MPSSCEQCQPADLLPENEDLREIVERFPGVINICLQTGRWTMNYPAAREVADAAGITNRLDFYEALEAIAKGSNSYLLSVIG